MYVYVCARDDVCMCFMTEPINYVNILYDIY